MNDYFTNTPSYMQPINPQEQAGLMPTFQNIASQQANQNAALAQQNQLNAQAGQTQSGGMNPMAMAAMLRKKPQGPGLGQITDANGNIVPDPTYGTGNAYGNMTAGESANMQANGI